MSYIYYLVTKVSYSSLQPIRGCVKRRVELLKRIITVLAVMAIMAAMVAAMAAPALADKGGGGHFKPTNSCSETECKFGASSSGGRGQGGGLFTVETTFDRTSFEETTVINFRGGFKDEGGGNCTTTVFPDGSSTSGGNGSRCN